EIQQKLYEEVMTALENSKSLTIPTVAELKSMPYLDMINKESMRIMTTVTALQREAMEDCVLSNGLMVPKGTQVHLQLWAIHHDPKIFNNPDVFDPERFRE
ncbi:cytochrome P450, partial [Conidiobolus coronatus NRRL 28638]